MVCPSSSVATATADRDGSALRGSVIPVGPPSTSQTDAVPAPPATTALESGVKASESTPPPCTAVHDRCSPHVAVSAISMPPPTTPRATMRPVLSAATYCTSSCAR